MADGTRFTGSILASMLFRHVEWRYTYFQPITPPIDEQRLSGPRSRPPITATPPPRTLATHEQDAIEAALMESKGWVAGPCGAASRLGLPSTTLESKINLLEIDKRRFKPQ